MFDCYVSEGSFILKHLSSLLSFHIIDLLEKLGNLPLKCPNFWILVFKNYFLCSLQLELEGQLDSGSINIPRQGCFIGDMCTSDCITLWGTSCLVVPSSVMLWLISEFRSCQHSPSIIRFPTNISPNSFGIRWYTLSRSTMSWRVAKWWFFNPFISSAITIWNYFLKTNFYQLFGYIEIQYMQERQDICFILSYYSLNSVMIWWP